MAWQRACAPPISRYFLHQLAARNSSLLRDSCSVGVWIDAEMSEGCRSDLGQRGLRRPLIKQVSQRVSDGVWSAECCGLAPRTM